MARVDRQHTLSWLLLAVLVLVAVGLGLVQSQYDPARWRAGTPIESSSGRSPSIAGTDAQPTRELDWAKLDGLSPPTTWEQYGPDTLSDKIDGKAELYLPAGFRQLLTGRFFSTSDASRWMEIFIYNMGEPTGAFAVFSQQIRANKQTLDLTPDAYVAANGLFMVHGEHYLEIVASDVSETLRTQMEALARAFIAGHPIRQTATLDERSLFPAADRLADSIALTAANAFGFERFDKIYTARYQSDGQEATAFLSHRASAAQAAELAQAYVDHLVSYGGRLVESPATVATLQVVDVLGTFDLVFCRGNYLGGVHEAATLEQGLALAQKVYNSLEKGTP